MTRQLALLLLILCNWTATGQDEALYDKVVTAAMPFITPIVQGDISKLYADDITNRPYTLGPLEEYKSLLADHPELIRYGYYLNKPKNKEGEYVYNSYALRLREDGTSEFFFAIAVSVDSENDFKVNGLWLFNKEEPLKEWWKIMTALYLNDEVQQFPKKYYSKIPPPPPYN